MSLSSGNIQRLIKRRILLVTVVMFGMILVLVFQFGKLQIVQGEYYREMSLKNRIRLKRVPAYRGNFFDRNMIPLAIIRPIYNATVTLEDVGSGRQEREEVFSRLERLLSLEKGTVMDKVGHARTRAFVPIRVKRNLSAVELANVEEQRLDLPGVGIAVEPIRGYPYGGLGAHIFGYMGQVNKKQLKETLKGRVRSGEIVGRTGLELMLNPYLVGKEGARQVEVDASGRTLKVMAEVQPLPGNNIVLTIDRHLQELAERMMAGRKGSLIAMDPNGGEILAMVSSPSYDPNLFALGISNRDWKKLIDDPRKLLLNRSVQSKLPPGSLFKPIMALAGLNEGIIYPEREIECTGVYKLGKRTYACWKRYGHGPVGIRESLVNSCNVFFYTIGHELGIDLIYKYATMFGLGAATGIDMTGEQGGLIPSPQWKRKRYRQSWFPGETVLVSIGQGYMQTTPLQLANMMCAIANRGTLYAPRLVDRITSYQGKLIKKNPSRIIRSIDIAPQYIEIVRDALYGVVNENGTGSKAKIEGLDIAGKTGTAQVVKKSWMAKLPEDKIPMEFRDHAWFVSFAPCREDARAEIVVAVMVENGGHGGSECAPLAKEIIKKFFDLKKVPKRVDSI